MHSSKTISMYTSVGICRARFYLQFISCYFTVLKIFYKHENIKYFSIYAPPYPKL